MIKYLRQNVIYLFLTLISLLSLNGAIIYYLYALNIIGVIISLILTIILFILITCFHYRQFKTQNNDLKYFFDSKPELRLKYLKIKINIILFIAYILLFSASFFILFRAQTDNSLISPWQAVPGYFFIVYFLASTTLWVLIKKGIKIPLLLISFHYFLSFSIALIVYKIGYGFDPFIHRATASLIDKLGAVYPKPPYYLGQYSLIIILHKLTSLPIIWLDKMLVPALTALLLPWALFKFLQKWFTSTKINLTLVLLVLALPFSPFIVTTPQNLAYLFLILTILLGFSCQNLIELLLVYLLAFTSLVSQPIAGISAVLFAIFITIYNSGLGKIKKYLYVSLALFSGAALPLSFCFIGGKAGLNLEKIKNYNIYSILRNFKISVPGQENFILNFVYLYIFNIRLIISFLIAIGLIISYKNYKRAKIFIFSLIIPAGLALSYFLGQLLPFNYLISYEQNNYLQRILIVTVFLLSPFILMALYNIVEKINKENKIIRLIFSIFFLMLLNASLYASYPRLDNYYNSHGYSVGKDDIDAVRWIEGQHQNNYIVLANQQVSVAALYEFGFKGRYLDKNNSKIYFYPIPTSSTLYQYYLDMVYKKAERKTMEKAMNYAGVKESYFVLNKYWWAFEKILNQAKLEANSYHKIANGNIYIFKYIEK